MGSVLSYFGSLTLVQGGLVNLNSGGGGWGGGCLNSGRGTKIYLSLLFYEQVTEKTKTWHVFRVP